MIRALIVCGLIGGSIIGFRRQLKDLIDRIDFFKTPIAEFHAPASQQATPQPPASAPTDEVDLEQLTSLVERNAQLSFVSQTEKQRADSLYTLWWFEAAYNRMYGTQLGVLEIAALRGPLSERAAKIFYNASTRQGNSATFQQYIEFLKGWAFVEETPEFTPAGMRSRYAITQLGREFLQYITTLGYVKTKPY